MHTIGVSSEINVIDGKGAGNIRKIVNSKNFRPGLEEFR